MREHDIFGSLMNTFAVRFGLDCSS